MTERSEPFRICHIITTIDLGGAEKQLVVLSALQVANGNKVSVIFLKGTSNLRNEFERHGVFVDDSIANRRFLFQVARMMKLAGRFDVIHCHLPRSEILGFLASLFGFRQSFIFGSTRHNAENFFPRGGQFISQVISRIVTLRVNFIIAISKSVADFNYQTSEISKEVNIDIVRYGFDPFFQKHNDLTVPLSEKFNWVIVARLAEQKNHSVLFHALSTLKNKVAFKLSVFGEGPLEANLKALSKSLGLDECVEWRGKAHINPIILSNFDLLFLPSRYEGFGLVLLEAMQAGTPVVASRVPAIVEVLGEDYVGLFEDNNSNSLAEIILLLQDTEARNVARKQLSNRLDLYSPLEMAGKVQEVYVRSFQAKDS